MVSLGSQTIKYALFLFNLLILVLSIVMISSGGVLLSSFRENNLDQTFDEVPRTSVILLIVVGVVTLVISFLGCCGAVKESYQLLYTYGTVLFILFVIEIVGAAVIFGFRNDIKEESIKGLMRQMKEYKYNNTGEYSVINDLQSSLHCCGAENLTDWNQFAPWSTYPPYSYPASCCKSPPLIADRCLIPWPTPCWEAIEGELRHSSRTLANTAIAVAVIQFLAMVSSCVLARNFKKEYDVV